MIKSYQKLLEMDSVASLKLEQDRQALEKIRKIIYQEKAFIVNKLIVYLKKEFNIDYFYFKVADIDGNIADILVKKDSTIFAENIDGKDFIDFNVENFIDSRLFDNTDEIILIDLNFDENLINLGYLCDSLAYSFLSYSKKLVDVLTTFVDYVIDKNICK